MKSELGPPYYISTWTVIIANIAMLSPVKWAVFIFQMCIFGVLKIGNTLQTRGSFTKGSTAQGFFGRNKGMLYSQTWEKRVGIGNHVRIWFWNPCEVIVVFSWASWWCIITFGERHLVVFQLQRFLEPHTSQYTLGISFRSYSVSYRFHFLRRACLKR